MIKNKMIKTNILFIIIIITVAICVGVLQYFDELLSKQTSMLISYVIDLFLIGIAVFWFINIKNRVMNKTIRYCLLISAVLLIFWLVVCFIKFHFFAYNSVSRIYLWYAYYIPQIFLPILMFIMAYYTDKSETTRFDKRFLLLIIPSLILCALIMTNNFHQQAFRFYNKISDQYGDYAYNWLYCLVTGIELLLILTSLAIMVKKCRISTAKKFTVIPLIVIVNCITLILICVFVTSRIFNITQLFCFSYILFFESCIQIGFIPSNRNYPHYFHFANINAAITDLNGKVLFNSASNYSPEIIKTVLKKSSVTNGNVRFSAKKINGGYIIWTDNLTKINDTNEKICEVRDRLSEENVLISAENELKEKMTKIRESQKLYDKTEKAVSKQTTIISMLAENMELQNNKEILAKIGVLGAYVKRRSNLTIIAESEKKLSLTELFLSIKESLDYLSLCDVNCACLCSDSAELEADTVLNLYDCMENIIENSLEQGIKSLLINIRKSKKTVIFRIISDVSLKLSGSLNNSLIELGISFRCIPQDETFYSEIKIEKGVLK